MSAALVLLADHELAASTLAARVAASTWCDPYVAVVAGLSAVNGVLHGRAGLDALALLAAGGTRGGRPGHGGAACRSRSRFRPSRVRGRRSEERRTARPPARARPITMARGRGDDGGREPCYGSRAERRLRPCCVDFSRRPPSRHVAGRVRGGPHRRPGRPHLGGVSAPPALPAARGVRGSRARCRAHECAGTRLSWLRSAAAPIRSRWPGGQGLSWRSGDVVLKPAEENPQITDWICDLLESLRPAGYRISAPLPRARRWVAGRRVDGVGLRARHGCHRHRRAVVRRASGRCRVRPRPRRRGRAVVRCAPDRPVGHCRPRGLAGGIGRPAGRLRRPGGQAHHARGRSHRPTIRRWCTAISPAT